MPTSQVQDQGIKPETQPGIEKRKTPSAAIARPERIRAELNIEKWPAIWNPTHSKIHSKTNVQPRTLERETNAADGTKSISKVTINPIAHLGDLTTDDQRTLYALIKHWEDRGKPPHETPFSIRAEAKLLHKKGWGTNVIDSVTGSLERLRGTMLVWTRAYRSKDQRVEDSETIYINVLSKLKNRISGGKVLKRGTRQVVNRASTALRLSASALLRSQSALGAKFRRLRSKLGAPKAITAMAHVLARLVYRMLKFGQEYVDRGIEFYETKYRQQQLQWVAKLAATLNMQLVQCT